VLAPFRPVATAEYPLDQARICLGPKARTPAEGFDRFNSSTKRTAHHTIDPKLPQTMVQRPGLALSIDREWRVCLLSGGRGMAHEH